ncbi:MAG TPA: SIR2 family protein, partial [Flavobacterium sp.]|nr:SIR2 family protein [Flavobacterium sp.]
METTRLPTIDEILYQIINTNEQHLFVFAGAGISINSGLPAAVPLLRKILRSLKLDSEDEAKLLLPNRKLAMPFEMFFDIFLKHERNFRLLDIFGKGEPNTFHYFISKCVASGRTSEVYTTNFDLLIEKAFNEEALAYSVFRDEVAFQNLKIETSPNKLVKLHGSYDQIPSIRTTLFSIANKNLAEQRDFAITRLFSMNSSALLLMLGYSCSDVFDVMPAIEGVTDPQITIVLVEHTPAFNSKDTCMIQAIQEPSVNNSFVRYRGFRVFCETESFVKWLWELMDDDYRETEKAPDLWSDSIEHTITSQNVDYSKYTILGRLFYNINDYDTALKYY